jgi:hypothetical protein
MNIAIYDGSNCVVNLSLYNGGAEKLFKLGFTLGMVADCTCELDFAVHSIELERTIELLKRMMKSALQLVSRASTTLVLRSILTAIKY